MLLTRLRKFTRSEQTVSRYVLAPFAWIFAAMACLSHLAAPDSEAASVIQPDLMIVETDPIERPPIRPMVQVQPRPIERGSFFADLRRPLNFNDWSASPWANDEPNAYYGGPWTPENVVQKRDRLVLQVRAGEEGGRPTMAELKTRQAYGFGRYEVIMRPSSESGVVSTFFTYTGPWSGDPHDEVDIEFVGKRSRTVEYNYWKNGRKGEYSREPLDFDFSDRMNLYAFEWHPNEIIWYVNGIEHYRSPRDRGDVPAQPGNIFISAWTGTPKTFAWTGKPDFGEGAEAEYACVSFTPFDGESYSCGDLWHEDPQFQREDLFASKN